MIKAFLRHHLDALDNGTSGATGFSNCHVRGLHSIMLHNEPANRIRLFFTTTDHELWKNGIWSEEMSLAYHPHHCDVRLVGVHGSVFNHELMLSGAAAGLSGGRQELTMCKYHSAINGGHGRLVDTGHKTNRYAVASTLINQYEHGLFLPAKVLHSIYVGRHERVAWLVFEGKEDPDYYPVCYTNNPNFDTEINDDMYVPMSKEQMYEALAYVARWM